MDAKLTLNVDKEIARLAKDYARSRGSSLSSLVENYLKMLIKQTHGPESEFSPTVKSLLGSVNLPEDFNYKKEIQDYLSEKHLKDA